MINNGSVITGMSGSMFEKMTFDDAELLPTISGKRLTDLPLIIV